jgi:hypothetical protein
MQGNLSIPEPDGFQPGPNSPLAWAIEATTHLRAVGIESTVNSSYDGPRVPLEEIGMWENFLKTEESLNDVYKFLIDNPAIYKCLCEDFTGKELRDFPWGPAEQGEVVNEQCLELQWSLIISGINRIIRICNTAVQNKEKPIYCIIGNGGKARKREPQAESIFPKRPDYAGFETNRPGRILEPEEIDNRIPGDAKLFKKISRSMLPPDGEKWTKQKIRRSFRSEVQKVMNQMYDYMDQHGARYGYVLNDEELVFFRRRGTGWGHMDVSPAIRHDVCADIEKGILNPKLVLFYFFMTAAPHRDRWYLPSNRARVVPRRNAFRSTRK